MLVLPLWYPTFGSCHSQLYFLIIHCTKRKTQKNNSALGEDLDHTDVWRARHTAEEKYTLFSTFTDCTKGSPSVLTSSHTTGFLQYNLCNPVNQTGNWRFTCSIWTDHKSISSYFLSFLSVNSASLLLWKTLKAYISIERWRQDEQETILESFKLTINKRCRS